MHLPGSRLAAFSLVLLAAASLGAAQATPEAHGIVTPFASAKFAQDADVKCLRAALAAGNPDTGSSTILLTATPGCAVPAHTHTAREQLIVVHGYVKTGMDGMTTTVLGPGGFAAMPGKAVHWFTCLAKKPCTMFVMFDARYDIEWVKRKP